MNFVKVDSTTIDDIKRRVIKFLRLGKSDIQTAFLASPFGVDGVPLKDWIAVYAPTGEKGKATIVGFLNKNQKAAAGEVRLYSVDSNGEEKFYTWLKANGTMELGGTADNAVRYSKLEEAFNELKQDFNTLVNTYNGHTHTGVTPGPGSTGTTPAAGSASSADISPAKINEIKTL